MKGDHCIRKLTGIIPSPKIKTAEKDTSFWRGRKISLDQKRWSNKIERSPIDEMLYQLLVRVLLGVEGKP